MKIWQGKLRLNADRKREGAEVDARVVMAGSGAVLFEISDDGGQHWTLCEPSEIHAASWLRALAETGKEVP